MGSPILAAAAAAAVVLVLAPAARADGELKPAAKARYDAGVKLTTAGKYDAAIREFLAAHAIDPDPVLFYSLAVAERLAGRCPGALDYYRRFLASRPSPERVEAAQKGMELCGDDGAKPGDDSARPGDDGAKPGDAGDPDGASKAAATPPAATRRAASPAKRPGSGASASATAATALPWYKNPVAGAIVVGVVGTAVGTGYLIASSGTHDRALDAQYSDEFSELLDRATTQRRIGGTVLALGAGLAVGAVVYHFAFSSSKQPSTSIAIGSRSIAIARSF
jgi:tetratricopeptide (TPR) repeat protein